MARGMAEYECDTLAVPKAPGSRRKSGPTKRHVNSKKSADGDD